MLALSIPHLWVPFHPRSLAMLGYQGPLSAPGIGLRVADRAARMILQVGRGGQRLSAEDVAIFVDRIPPRVTVAMYRTFLTREVAPLARGRYESSRLKVPSTVMVGSRDLVTRGLDEAPVDGQPDLSVEVVDGVAHWLPEQRPEAILEWIARGDGPTASEA
jgi:pimeloyl-ACP methyl ester carboxylesterase